MRTHASGDPRSYQATPRSRRSAGTLTWPSHGPERRAGVRGVTRGPVVILASDENRLHGYLTRMCKSAVLRYLRRRGIGAVIPRRSNEPPQPTFDRDAYRERNRVERLFNRLKQHRAIATRYDKRADHYAACLLLAAILLWL